MKTSKAVKNISYSVFVLNLLVAVLLGSKVGYGEKYLFLQKDDSSSKNEEMTLVVLTWPEKGSNKHIEGCEVFTDQELVGEILRSTKDPHILKTTDEEMDNLLEDCSEISRRRKRESSDADEAALRRSRDRRNRRRKPNPKPEEDTGPGSDDRNPRSQFDNGPPNRLATPPPDEGLVSTTTVASSDGWPIIWPGTKWCGSGDIAKNHDDLGFHADTDKCCRAHDLCDDLLVSGETRNNLTNKSSFTKLSCKCDEDFYNCLSRVDSVTSNSIGNLYFNVLKRECYAADYPQTSTCKKYLTLFKITCKEYEIDTTAPKVYQWKKPQLYRNIPFPGPLTVTLPF